MRQIILIDRPIQLQIFRRLGGVFDLAFPALLLRGASFVFADDFADGNPFDCVVLFEEVGLAVDGAEGPAEGFGCGEFAVRLHDVD